MKRVRAQFALLAISCAVGALAIAGTSSAATKPNLNLVKPGYLTVANIGSYPPWITVSRDGKLGGLDGEYLNKVAASLGLKVKLYQTTFASMILAVKQHKADVGVYLSYTPERAKQVYYTLPWQVAHQAVYTKKDFAYTGPASLEGKKVGTVNGYLQQGYLQSWCKDCTKLFPNEVTGNTALLNGQIDAWVDASTQILSPPFSTHKADLTSHPIKVGDFNIPKSFLQSLSYNVVSCQSKGLATAMNKEIRRLHSTGRWGTLLKSVGLTSAFSAPLTAPKNVC